MEPGSVEVAFPKLHVPVASLRLPPRRHSSSRLRLPPYSFSVPLLSFSGMQLQVIPSFVDVCPRRRHPSLHQQPLHPLRPALDLHRPRSPCHRLHLQHQPPQRVALPIRTVWLSRNREQDKALMKRLLKEEELGGGRGLLVCPEGTTCREPYLLRFSPLFAEVSHEVAPMALQSWVTMFHDTSTGKLKYLDRLYFLMNSSPSYAVEFMAKAGTRRVGGRECDSREMANHLHGGTST
ncbi:hypothetical protein Cni_G09516 [Canna indica]|uniref:Phospholipid/glycerol acyltransferase domain-containing protein n=1 Tax=Canna indica TaxID=4628 RepID=A0AAQ3K4Y2_9LILI|nr:hypothetical protein Cni_G09516 [Canna indica]